MTERPQFHPAKDGQPRVPVHRSEAKKQASIEAYAAGADIAELARIAKRRQKYVRLLLAESEFQAVAKREKPELRKRQEPSNLATAISIRDDPASPPMVKLQAIDFITGRKLLRGVGRPRRKPLPLPAVAAQTSCGYVIRGEVDERPVTPVTDHPASGFTPISPRSNIGDTARDVEQERKEDRRWREGP